MALLIFIFVFVFFLSFSSSSLLSSQDLVLFTEIFTGITLFVLDVYFCYPIAVCWSVGNIIKYSEFWMSSIFYSIFAKLSENLVSCGADSETQDKIKLLAGDMINDIKDKIKTIFSGSNEETWWKREFEAERHLSPLFHDCPPTAFEKLKIQNTYKLPGTFWQTDMAQKMSPLLQS